MAKSDTDRIAYLESELKALREALAKLFHMPGLAPFDPDDTNAADELDAMTIAQLKDWAESKGIELNGAKTKGDILAAIKAKTDA